MDNFGCITVPGAPGSIVSQTACNGSADQTVDVHW
jgi:hypothetical protein